MKGTIKFIATERIQKECIELIKAEDPKLSNDLLQWNIIIDKVTTRLYNSKYFENKGDLCIRIKNNNDNQKPVAFQSLVKDLKVTPRMIAKLYTDNNDIAVANFFSSIGHERGHNADYPKAYIFQFLEGLPIPILKEIEQILSYPNEVLADYYSCSKWLNKDIDLFIDCIKYKSKEDINIKEKKEKTKKEKSNTHPTWEQRIKYLQIGKFDKNLLHTIIKDTDCENNKRINKYMNKLFNYYCKNNVSNNITYDVLLK